MLGHVGKRYQALYGATLNYQDWPCVSAIRDPMLTNIGNPLLPYVDYANITNMGHICALPVANIGYAIIPYNAPIWHFLPISAKPAFPMLTYIGTVLLAHIRYSKFPLIRSKFSYMLTSLPPIMSIMFTKHVPACRTKSFLTVVYKNVVHYIVAKRSHCHSHTCPGKYQACSF